MAIISTSRLGLTKDDNTELYDVGRVNANTQKIDDNIGTIVCTSSTRPSSPYNGMTIYETDTGFHGVWRADISAWVIPRAGLYASSSRPTVGLYEGYTYYRTDKDFHEVYDGSVWRVIGNQPVASLSDITSPKTGQLAVLTSDSWEYRWNGSAWVAVRPIGIIPNIKRRLNATTAVSAGTNTKVPFDTIIGTAVDISHSSGEFTFSKSGWYRLNCSVRVSGLTTIYLWFSRGSGVSNYYRGKTSGDGGLNFSATADVEVTAGDVWSAWIWGLAGFSLQRETAGADDWPPYFTATFIGPS